MMGNKTISLSYELDLKLKKEENASALISNLLKDYYEEKDIKGLSIKELNLMIKKEEAKLEYEKKLQELQ